MDRELALKRTIEEFESQNSRSRAMSGRAAESLPGGTTRSTTFFPPFPPTMTSGAGSVIVDIDGNERVDFLNNYTSLIHGHAHAQVLRAAQSAAARGTAFAAPTEFEVGLAELLCNRVDSIDKIRFTNSGTEATMAALRLARAHTGRPMIARFEDSYHGTHDYAAAPAPGVPDAVDALVVTLPYNDIDACMRTITARAGDLAAVIVEPVLGAGGVVPGRPDFLTFLRAITEELGIVLIFDEIISFRLSVSGAQKIFGVVPDLTTLGKIIGGGFAIGAFGGREDIMALLDPQSGPISWGGTFNGNPVAAAAGITAMELLPPETIARLNEAGERLLRDLQAVAASSGEALRVTGMGSLFNIHAGDDELLRIIHLGLLNRGYYLAPRGMGCLSTVTKPEDLDGLVATLSQIVDGV